MERKPDWLPDFPVQIYCNRRYCRNSGNGGAVHIETGWAMFKNCRFTNNSAAYGGAVYVAGNTAENNYYSYGTRYSGSLAKFVGCTFSGNSATSAGPNAYIGAEMFNTSMDYVIFEGCSGVTNGTYKGNSDKTGKVVG